MPYYSGTSTLNKQEQISSKYVGKDEQLNYRYPLKNQNYSHRQERQSQFPSSIRNASTQKQTVIQQQQISDLQMKIDLILMHNQKLESEKERYRLLYEEIRSQKSQIVLQSNTARFITEENQLLIEKLRQQMELSANNYQNQLNDVYQSKKILKQEVQTLSKITDDLSQQNKNLKITIKQQSLKIQSLKFQLKEDFNRQQAEFENKLRDEFLIRQIQLKNQKNEAIEAYQTQIQALKSRFDQEKASIFKSHQEDICNLKKQFQNSKKNLSTQLNNEFQTKIEWFKNQNQQNLKKQKDKAFQYIKQHMQNLHSQDQQIRLQYRQEIDQLKQSLDGRKRLIDALLSQQLRQIPEHEEFSDGMSWLPELIGVRQQLRQLTNQYLQQSELLKLKLTQKFEKDVQSLKKIYEDKIQLMSLQNQRTQQQLNRLRGMYEKSLRNQIENRKEYQLERSTLKNVIRKLNVELHGIQEEFKINIEGVKDQNSVFSMTMMKSMLEVKQKANFYSEENRKLRKAYDDHERQLTQQKKQFQEKIDYYESSYLQLKQKYKNQIKGLRAKIDLIQQEFEERENQLRENLNKQHQTIQSVVENLRKDTQQLSLENEDLKKKNQEISIMLKNSCYQTNELKSLVSHLEADIQRLKLDLSMADVDDKDHLDTINEWKNHYQNQISELEHQKNIINKKVAQRDQQLTQIIKKYKLLEDQLAKVVETLKKHSHFEERVIELGLDNNLVQNMFQLFGRAVQASAQCQ